MQSPEKLKIVLQYDPASTGHVPKGNEISMLKRQRYSHVHFSAIHNSQDGHNLDVGP
jgi:hypothetical protein